jgi:C-5 cytosine-specific DNA methylase
MKSANRPQLRLVGTKRSVAPDLSDRSGSALPSAGLFAGIGGVELGLSRSDHETLLLCEFDSAAKAVLEDRFSGAQLAHDVRDLRSLPKATELLTAGFPCQDLSQAGKTAGIGGARSGLVGEGFSSRTYRSCCNSAEGEPLI